MEREKMTESTWAGVTVWREPLAGGNRCWVVAEDQDGDILRKVLTSNSSAAEWSEELLLQATEVIYDGEPGAEW